MARAFLLLLAVVPHYLMMQPIERSLRSGEFSALARQCRPRIAVNLEAPLAMRGYQDREQFSRGLAERFRRFTVENIEWGSLQVESGLAVQSLNIVLLDRIGRRRTIYKLILFMTKETEWTLYYLRGLRL